MNISISITKGSKRSIKAKNTKADPVSGCKRIRTTGRNINKPALTKVEVFFMFRLNLLRNFARASATAGFVNSDG